HAADDGGVDLPEHAAGDTALGVEHDRRGHRLERDDALERGDAARGLVVEADVRHGEAALEGLGGGGVVARVDAEHLDVLSRVVRVDGGEVAGLGPAGRAGGVPEVEDDDVAAPVREVELV